MMQTLITAAAFAATGGNALAVNWTGTAGDNWQDTANWGGNPIPGVGAETGSIVTFLTDNDTIDLNGASVSVGAFNVSANAQTFATTGTPATITCTSLNFPVDNANHFDQHFYPDIVVNGGFTQLQKNYRFYFHGALTAESLAGIQGGPVEVRGPLTVTDGNPVEIFFTTAAGLYRGGGQNYSLYDVLTCGAGVALNSYDPGSPVRMTANAATTLSGVTGTFDVGTNSTLNLVLAQTTLPSGGIVVQPYGLLHGAMGETTTWGPGNDIDVKPNAILAIASGTEPTTDDIGADVAWKAVTSSGTTTVGTPGTTIFKGLAVAGTNVGASNSLTGHTLQSTTGAVEIMFLGGLYWQTSQSAAIESLDQTGIANMHMRVGLSAKGGKLNPAPNADSVTTFNFIGEALDTAQIANLYWNFEVKADQTFNFSGTGTVTIDPDYMKGQLTFSDTTMYDALMDANNGQFKNKGTAGYENTKLTFNDGAALAIDSSEISLLENLAADQIVTSGTPILTLKTSGSNLPATITPQFNINAADTPNLVEFMKKSNINVNGGNNNYADLLGEGIIVGDGKYLTGYSNSHKGIYLRAAAHDEVTNPSGPATISGVSGAATMGIACNSNNAQDYLGIIIPVDAKGAKLVLNNDQVMTTAMSGNLRSTEAPNNKILLQGPITNTPEIDVRNGTIDFNTGVSVPAGVALTLQGGATANVNTAVTVDTLSGNGKVNSASNLTFSTVAPGTSVGSLNLGAFTIAVGTTYQCEISGAGGGTPVAGTDNDVITGTTVTIDGAWKLNLVNSGLAAGALTGDEIFKLVDATSVPAFDAGNVQITATGFDVSGVTIYTSGGDILLTGLLVSGGATSPYDTWAAQIPDTNQRGRGDDPDGDGFSNGEEFLFGSSPVAGNGSLVTTTSSGGNLVLRWLQRESGATYTLQQSATLEADSWTTAAQSPALDGDQTGAPTDYDYHTVTIPVGGGKLFYRIMGVEN